MGCPIIVRSMFIKRTNSYDGSLLGKWQTRNKEMSNHIFRNMKYGVIIRMSDAAYKQT